MKRFISVVSCFLIIFSNFCLVAFADDDSNITLFDFILGYYSNTYYKNNIANDSEKLIDFYSTTPGKLVTLSQLYGAGSSTLLPLSFVAKNDLDNAVTSRYIAAGVDREFVEALDADCVDLASRNGHRAYNFEQLHLSTSDPITTDYLHAIGSPPINNIGTKWNANIQAHSGYYSVGYPNDSTISFYCGGQFPPCFYVPRNCDVYQNGTPLGTGFYIILGDNLLLKHQSGSDSAHGNYGNGSGRISLYYFGDQLSSSITFGLGRGELSTGKVSGRAESCPILSSGQIIGQINSGSYDGATVTDLVERMCGFYVYPPSYVDETPETFLPDDVPYEDNQVVIMVPIDEPSEPVYMAPSTYNTYVENGDIYNFDDHSINNDIVNNDTVNNIYNIYNNYVTNNNYNGGSYDDSTLLHMLNSIINKLNDINDSINSIKLPSLTSDDVDPCYVNFWDCITLNMPIIGTVRDMYSELTSGIDSSSVSTNDILSIGSDNSKLPEASGGSIGEPSGEPSFTDVSGFFDSYFGGFRVDMSFYDRYRNKVRDVMGLFAYGLGFCSFVLSLKRAFRLDSTSLTTTGGVINIHGKNYD